MTAITALLSGLHYISRINVVVVVVVVVYDDIDGNSICLILQFTAQF